MNKEQIQKHVSVEPIPPGETLLEILEEKGITQAELSQRIDRPTKTINGIIKGNVAITPETALQLELVLGVPAYIWNNLESQFQEAKLRIKTIEVHSELVDELKDYPYDEMAGFGWIPQTKNPLERVGNLLSFFGVTDFKNIIEEKKLGSAFRIASKTSYSMGAIVASLRKGSIDAELIQTKPYDEKKLRELLPVLRQMTFITNPNELMPKLQEEFRKCGVAFVVNKNLVNAPISGATRWVSPDKVLLQMSIRLGWADVFWFTLFHEIGHILLDGKKDFNLDMIDIKIDSEKEKEKDIFASDYLIPRTEYEKLVPTIRALATNKYLGIYRHIEHFSKFIKIHPCIVNGRLQHDKLIPMTLNRSRVRFSWKK